MNKSLFVFALVAMTPLAVPDRPAAATIATERIPSDIPGVDLIITCDLGPFVADYVAQTASGVSPTDRYSRARGADKGLVHLMNKGGRPARRYVVSHRLIRAVVSLKYDMDVLDKADLVFASNRVTLIHTTTANAGIFIVSDVWELPIGQNGSLDETSLRRNGQLSHMVDLGLSAYRPSEGECRPPVAR